jgi:hypothetical protein
VSGVIVGLSLQGERAQAPTYALTWADAAWTAEHLPICMERSAGVTFFESERHGHRPKALRGWANEVGRSRMADRTEKVRLHLV